MPREKIIKESRYLCQLIFNSVNAIQIEEDGKTSVEKTVNAKLEEIARKGGKVISITSHTYGISPMNLIYDIIYQAENSL